MLATLTQVSTNPPSITTQPTSQTITVGDTATFNVAATGTAPLTYQWRYNNADTAGATQPSLALSNVQFSQAGGYSVVVANSAGSVTSAVATLTVNPPPVPVRVVSVAALAGGEARVPVQLVAGGNENAVAFNLNFDGALLALADVALGADAPGGSILIVNTNLAGTGKVGVAVALPAGASFNAGTQEVVAVRFSVASVTNPATIPITFGDRPTTRQVSDGAAHVVPATFIPGDISIRASTIRVVNTTAASGGEASLRVQLLAQGNENAAGFSLNFDSALLSLADVALGADAPAGSALAVNSNDAGSGKVGVAVALAANATFSAGTREIAVIRFAVAPVLNAVTSPVAFGDQPTTRQLSDAQARVLPSVFVPGNVAIVDVEFEGDAATRPDGDRSLTVIDGVQLGRFVAGLDTPSGPAEFQRIDCAQRAIRGNGAITVTDYVQAGRYMVGLDPVTPVGEPTSPGGGGGGGGGFQPASSGRTLCLLNTSIVQGQTNVVPVSLEASGNENAVAFSVAFDATKLRFVRATNGSAAATASVTVNPNDEDAGRLGLVVALSPGNTLAAGTREVVRIYFAALPGAPSSLPVAFGDLPVFRETSDPGANDLNTDYTPGTVSVTPPPGPPLQLTRTGATMLFFCPSSATGFELEGTVGALGTSWLPISSFSLGDQQKGAFVTITGGERYFRLKHP